MANREPEPPKKQAGYEFFKDVAWFSAAIFLGAVALHSLGTEIGRHHISHR